MSTKSDGDEYAFRVPFASSIYRRATFDETLTALLDSDANKIFPVEILLFINKEVHTNPNQTYKEIHSIWTAVTHKKERTGYSSHLNSLLFDKDKKTFSISKTNSYNNNNVACSASASDMLYRVLCFFPDAYTRNLSRSAWMVSIRHKPSGIILGFGEHRGAFGVNTGYNDKSFIKKDSEAGKAFTADALRLLNTFFKTVDGKRFAYFHPAAEAYSFAGDEKYLAIPASVSQDRFKKNRKPYDPWYLTDVSFKDMFSFQSLLPKLTYNIETRKVDAVRGSMDLTSVISSSLLFYRLRGYYCQNHVSVNRTPPITSIWQVKLEHRKNGTFVVFMDDHGLFDIRASKGAKEVMDDIVAFVNALCSDKCSPPYDD